MSDKIRRVVTYERVSSEDQRDRETIKTQSEFIARNLANEPGVELVERYIDDGVSGTIPMGQRPAGRRLMADARRRLFDEVWIYNVKRLGREDVDPLVVWQECEALGIKIHSVTEGFSDLFMYHIHVALAAKDRRDFLGLSAEGMARAAREGRYTGGIVPLGYRVEGKKPHARLVPSEIPMWGDLTESDVPRKMYDHLTVDIWSCRRIAEEFNALGIPTAYQKDGRGIRGKRTQGKWHAGHIRNLVINPVYRGELQYGRRTTKPGGREIIKSRVEPLVSDEIWYAAQRTLERYRIAPTGGVRRTYLLRSVVRCGTCGRNYCGVPGRPGEHWFRCGGKVERGFGEARCPAKGVRGDWLEGLVWADLERWLRDPGPMIAELDMQDAGKQKAAAVEAERVTLEKALADAQGARDRAIDLCVRKKIDEVQLDRQLAQLGAECMAIEKRLEALEATETPQDGLCVAPDALAEIRARLDAGLDLETRQKLVQWLCRIQINTTIDDAGKKTAQIAIRYRFPAEPEVDAESSLPDVVPFCTGRGSWRLPCRAHAWSGACASRRNHLSIGARYPSGEVDITVNVLQAVLLHSRSAYLRNEGEWAKSLCSLHAARARGPRFPRADDRQARPVGQSTCFA